MIQLFTQLSAKKPIPLEFWTFPGGERNVKIPAGYVGSHPMLLTINVDFKGSNDLIDLMLLVNAIRNSCTPTTLNCTIPYFPFARQDRVMTEGEALALQIPVQIIKMCNFDNVTVWDPHSDVLEGMFEPGKLTVLRQWDIAKHHISNKNGKTAIISPDAGALKKIYKLAKLIDCTVIEATKVRNVATGNITSTQIDGSTLNDFDVLWVVDDIIDGGRTFAELAKVINQHGYTGQLNLFATHGILSAGIFALNGFDKVILANNMSGLDQAALAEFNTIPRVV